MSFVPSLYLSSTLLIRVIGIDLGYSRNKLCVLY